MTSPLRLHGHGSARGRESASAARRRAPTRAAPGRRAARASCRAWSRRRSRRRPPGRRSRRWAPRRARRPSSVAARVRSRERVPRPHDLEARALHEVVHVPRRRDRDRDTAAAPGEREQPDDEQEAELGGHRLPTLVDEQQPLCSAVEDDSEVGANARHDPSRVERLELPRRVVLDVEPTGSDRLDAERAEHERQRERCGRVAVVDRNTEPAARDRVRCRPSRGCPARSSRGPAPGRSSPPPPRTSRAVARAG